MGDRAWDIGLSCADDQQVEDSGAAVLAEALK